MGRIQVTIAYTTLLATCVAGVFHLSWWWALAGACSLALTSLIAHRAASYAQLRAVSEPVLVASSLLNASGAAFAVYLFGYFARWIWGL